MGEIIRDNLAHIDRLGLCHRVDEICAVCGKSFYRTSEHIYRHNRYGKDLFECSWTCYREMCRRIDREGGKHSRKKEKKSSNAQNRIEFCQEKIRHYTAKANGSPPSSRKRKNARDQVKVWKEKLEEAKRNEGRNT